MNRFQFMLKRRLHTACHLSSVQTAGSTYSLYRRQEDVDFLQYGHCRSYPLPRLSIKPELSSRFGGSLPISVAVKAPNLKSGETLVDLPEAIDNVLAQMYDGNTIQI